VSDFKGWDPYDGLNSKIFQATPFKYWDLARMAWIQGFKHSPINFRKLLLVPKGYNAKGISLFLTGYYNIYKAQQMTGKEDLGKQEEVLEKIEYLANLLIAMQSKGYSGACWGYNFDWQSKAFFLPKYTPTVVVTSFVVEALFNAFEATGKEIYKKTALSSAEFILNDLNRIEKPNGFMFSYSPKDNRAVYNASLLGTKTLALINKYNQNPDYFQAAYASAKAVCDVQNPDGSFPHSDQVGNKWRDSFHTGFKLESLSLFQNLFNNNLFNYCIESGFNYWINQFFDHKSGKAYYYDIQGNLVDLHCAAQALATLYKLKKMDLYSDLVFKIIEWAIENMQSENGSFYFQRKGNIINKICYMRWPNAWIFYGMSYYLLNMAHYENN
jgi:hypothetical protein